MSDPAFTDNHASASEMVAVPRERLLKLLEYADAEYVPNSIFNEFRRYLEVPVAEVDLERASALIQWVEEYATADVGLGEVASRAGEALKLLGAASAAVQRTTESGNPSEEAYRDWLTRNGYPHNHMRALAFEYGYRAGKKASRSPAAVTAAGGGDGRSRGTDGSRVLADLSEEVRKIDADFPDFATWEIELPAGHWRALANRGSTGAEAVLAAAAEEYRLDHPVEDQPEKVGRRSAIRGLLVRLGLYGQFCEHKRATSQSNAEGG